MALATKYLNLFIGLFTRDKTAIDTRTYRAKYNLRLCFACLIFFIRTRITTVDFSLKQCSGCVSLWASRIR
jgi:hypothetical protein